MNNFHFTEHWGIIFLISSKNDLFGIRSHLSRIHNTLLFFKHRNKFTNTKYHTKTFVPNPTMAIFLWILLQNLQVWAAFNLKLMQSTLTLVKNLFQSLVFCCCVAIFMFLKAFSCCFLLSILILRFKVFYEVFGVEKLSKNLIHNGDDNDKKQR